MRTEGISPFSTHRALCKIPAIIWIPTWKYDDLNSNVSSITGEGNGTLLQYSCLEKSMDRGAWEAAVHGVAKSRARLSDFTFTFHFHALEKEMATHSIILAWRIPGAGEIWWAAVYGVAQSWTQLKRLSSSSSSQHHLLNNQRHCLENSRDRGP